MNLIKKSTLYALLISLASFINSNRIEEGKYVDSFKELHPNGKCSLEEILFLDKDIANIALNSTSFQTISTHQKDNILNIKENETIIVGKNVKLDLAPYFEYFPYLEEFPYSTKLVAESNQNVAYLKIIRSPSERYYFDIFLKNITLQNGAFIIKANDKLSLNVLRRERTRSVPSRIFLIDSNNNIIDKVLIFKKTQNPDFFISGTLINKDSLTAEDLENIVKSYIGKTGNYYEFNDIDFVCTDLLSSLIYSTGIDIEKALSKIRKKFDPYDTRRAWNYIKFFREESLLKKTIYHNNKKEGFPEPEHFGLTEFNVGDVLFFDRYYAEGPFVGKVQRENVHVAIITQVSNDKKSIEKSVMVTGTGKKLEDGRYEEYCVCEMDFKPYYERLQGYISDETPWKLNYTVGKVQKLLQAINIMKKAGYHMIEAD